MRPGPRYFTKTTILWRPRGDRQKQNTGCLMFKGRNSLAEEWLSPSLVESWIMVPYWPAWPVGEGDMVRFLFYRPRAVTRSKTGIDQWQSIIASKTFRPFIFPGAGQNKYSPHFTQTRCTYSKSCLYIVSRKTSNISHLHMFNVTHRKTN